MGLLLEQAKEMMEIFTSSLKVFPDAGPTLDGSNDPVLMEERIKEIEEDKHLELQITKAYMDADSFKLEESSENNN